MKRFSPFGILLAAIAIAAGYGAMHTWQRYRNEDAQRRVHSEIASLRTYEEAYALRHGHYLLVPNSCSAGNDARWRELGKSPPTPDVGCFWVTAPGAATHAVTAPAMHIVGENAAARLRGIESSDDRAPTWTPLP